MLHKCLRKVLTMFPNYILEFRNTNLHLFRRVGQYRNLSSNIKSVKLLVIVLIFSKGYPRQGSCFIYSDL